MTTTTGSTPAREARLAVIDSDGHVFEPFAMWPERLPAEFHDRMWRRERLPDGTEQVTFYGQPTNMEWTVGSLCTPGGLSAADGPISTWTPRSTGGSTTRLDASS